MGRGDPESEDRRNADLPDPRPSGRIDGWPDWIGEKVAILASGPSTKKTDIAALRGKARVIAIKQNFDLCPWADLVYGCDAPWWRFRRGLPEYKGLKVTWSGAKLNEYPQIKTIGIAMGQAERFSQTLEFDSVGTLGGGGNSGFQALNLAIQLGARDILLVGFDMCDRGGTHWYGRNNWAGANNPTDENFRRWLPPFERAAPILQKRGVQVFNASSRSALKCFPFATVEGFLAA